MISFLIELYKWLKARKYSKDLAGKPYFWGSPNSRNAAMRYEAFLKASGLK